MLEKTYTTFHTSNVLLHQQYRERRFTKYYELIAYLLVAKQNNELLLKNHQSRPTGSIPLPEANATIQVNRCGRGHGHRYYGQGRGRGRYNSWNQDNYNRSQNKNNTSNNHKLNRSEKLSRKATGPHNKKFYETECYIRGIKGH